METENTTAVSLPTDLVETVRQRATKTGYDRTDEYLEQVVRATLDELESVEHSSDDAEVRDRLQSLGYLDN